LFSESNSRFVITVPANRRAEFEAIMADVACEAVGKVTLDSEVVLRQGEHISAVIPLAKAAQSYKSTLDQV